jgi:hypothetical protein
MAYQYIVYGLIIDSCLEFPELIPVDHPPDVEIRWGAVSEFLDDPVKITSRFQVKPDQIILTETGAARILVVNGREILIDKFPGADEALVRSMILGSAMGAIFHQRGLLPLHASGVQMGNHCVVFCGKRGTGKSTLASMLMRRGYLLHADDVCVIGLNQENMPVVFPGYPQLKLMRDALSNMDLDAAPVQPVLLAPNKYALPALQFNQHPLPAKAIFSLSPQEADEIKITQVFGISKFNILNSHIFRRKILQGQKSAKSPFIALSVLSKRIPVFRVTRPKNRYALDELTDALEKIILSIEG